MKNVIILFVTLFVVSCYSGPDVVYVRERPCWYNYHCPPYDHCPSNHYYWFEGVRYHIHLHDKDHEDGHKHHR